MAEKLGYQIKSVDKGILKVEVDPHYECTEDNIMLLDILHERSKNSPQNILITGPQGCGKTELAVWFAAKYDRPVLIMNCAVIREARDWFGYKDAKDGSILWHKSAFARAVEEEDCVILLDEFNRLHASCYNTLYPLLDNRRSTYIEEIGENLTVAKGAMFFACVNQGYEFTGTYKMDLSLEDRWSVRIDLDYLSLELEAKVIEKKTGLGEASSNQLASLAYEIRRKARGSSSLSRSVSTRQMLEAASLMNSLGARGESKIKGLFNTVLPYYSSEGGTESERAQVEQLIQGKFPS